MILVCVHEIKFEIGTHEGIFPDVALSSSFFSFLSEKYKNKVQNAWQD